MKTEAPKGDGKDPEMYGFDQKPPAVEVATGTSTTEPIPVEESYEWNTQKHPATPKPTQSS